MMMNLEYVPTIAAENDEKINFRVDVFLENKRHIYENIGTASVVLSKESDALLYFRAISNYVDHTDWSSSVIPWEEIETINNRIIEVCKDLKAVWV